MSDRAGALRIEKRGYSFRVWLQYKSQVISVSELGNTDDE